MRTGQGEVLFHVKAEDEIGNDCATYRRGLRLLPCHRSLAVLMPADLTSQELMHSHDTVKHMSASVVRMSLRQMSADIFSIFMTQRLLTSRFLVTKMQFAAKLRAKTRRSRPLRLLSPGHKPHINHAVFVHPHNSRRLSLADGA